MNERERLIDADALKERMCRQCNVEYSEAPCDPDDCFVRLVIMDAPTVDAVEVVRGKWIWDDLNECWVCSNCEASALNNYRWQSVDSNYCPNCGAKMDGGEEE